VNDALCATLVAVDWGTSHLRVWALGPGGDVVAEHKSDEGMGSTARERFDDILESHLGAMSVPTGIPVIMCGMVGSRQGWAEAGYLPIPADLREIAANAVRIPGCARDIRILPGLSKNVPENPDVMRGEETQLIGLTRTAPVESGETRVVCMPGTHSKWVHMTGERVEDFASFMTGDMFSALAAHSVLRHSLSEDRVDHASSAFLDAVRASLVSPSDISARIFSIRPAGLLQNPEPSTARAKLSGYLIGQEIAGAKSRFPVPAMIDLVGGGVLGALYEAALSVASVTCRVHDGDRVVRAGLIDAASVIWKTESA
jgi:2-dehydro-3-deoxygalactonokinase